MNKHHKQRKSNNIVSGLSMQERIERSYNYSADISYLYSSNNRTAAVESLLAYIYSTPTPYLPIEAKIIYEFLTEGMFKGYNYIVKTLLNAPYISSFTVEQRSTLLNSLPSSMRDKTNIDINAIPCYVSDNSEYSAFMNNNNSFDGNIFRDERENLAATQKAIILQEYLLQDKSQEALQYFLNWIKTPYHSQSEIQLFFEYLTVGDFAFCIPALEYVCSTSKTLSEAFSKEKFNVLFTRYKNVIQATGLAAQKQLLQECDESFAKISSMQIRSREDCINFLNSFFADMDGEMQCITNQTLSLVDPVNLTRIITPARSYSCAHLTTFDLRRHLERWLLTSINKNILSETDINIGLSGQIRRLEWSCPICREPATRDQIYIDSFIKEILNHCSASNVRIQSDGKWTPDEQQTTNVEIIDLSNISYEITPDEENWLHRLKIKKENSFSQINTSNMEKYTTRITGIPHLESLPVNSDPFLQNPGNNNMPKPNLNNMTAVQIRNSIRGIGKKYGNRIISLREELGGSFSDLNVLQQVLPYGLFTKVIEQIEI